MTKESDMLTIPGLILLGIALGAGGTVGLRALLNNKTGDSDVVEATNAPIVKHEETVQEVVKSERADPLCTRDAVADDPLPCLLIQCWQHGTAEGQTDQSRCAEIRKRVLDLQRWELCKDAPDMDSVSCWTAIRQ